MPKKENDARRLARLCDEAAETREILLIQVIVGTHTMITYVPNRHRHALVLHGGFTFPSLLS